MIIKMYYIQCSNNSSFSRTAHKNDLVPAGKGLSDLLVSVLQTLFNRLWAIDANWRHARACAEGR